MLLAELLELFQHLLCFDVTSVIHFTDMDDNKWLSVYQFTKKINAIIPRMVLLRGSEIIVSISLIIKYEK